MIDDKNEIEQQETDEFAVFMYGQVIDDSNNWELMDSTELNKRVKAYNKDDSIENAVRLYSCLRFAETYFLVEKKGDGILVCQDESDKKFLLAYTAKKYVPEIIPTPYKADKFLFYDCIEGLKDDINVIVLNGDSEKNIVLEMDSLMEFYAVMDKIETAADSLMSEGLSGEMLTDLIFDRFFGRNIYCELKDGRKIEGEVGAVDESQKELPVYNVETKNGIVQITKADVAYIKDIGYNE